MNDASAGNFARCVDMAGNAGSQGEAVQDVKDALDADLLDSADSAGVDVDEIITEKLDNHSGYGAGTVARFVSSEVQRQIEAEQADELKGILMGSRDRYGRNWPRRWSLVRSSGDHLEVSTWEGKLPGPDGQDVRIPTGGAIVAMRAEYDSQYESYEGARLESVKSLKPHEVVENVGKIAKRPGDISRDDEYNVVAVKGTIEYVNPQTIFEDGEPKEDGPVLLADERGEPRPHFEVTLRIDGDTMVRGHLERMKYAQPYLDVLDLKPLTEDAAELPNPDEQAQFLEDGLKGVEVLMVGNVSSVDVTRSDEQGGGKRTYVDIGVTALVDTAVADEGASATADVTESGADDDPEPEADPEAEDDDGAGDTQGGAGEQHDQHIDKVREQIKQYASLVGEDIDDLTVDDVQDAMDLDAPDVVVREALKGHATADAPEEAADDGADDGADDPLEAIKKGGTYNCPAGECLAQASSEAELLGHINDAHGAVNPADLEEWVREKADA
jgi:hypothetical protein